MLLETESFWECSENGKRGSQTMSTQNAKTGELQHHL